MISAVVILYHPEPTVNDNLKPILTHTRRLYVFDNTEKSQLGLLHADIANHPKLVYRHMGTNEGIAHPLNVACRLAVEEGYHYLLTMDQDSLFEPDELEKYISAVLQFPESESAGMFGVNHTSPKSIVQRSPAYESVSRLITSGSILNLQNFERIGNFDEQLFIDHVDSEYCFRTIQHGLRNILFKDIFLHHQLGIVSKHTSLKNLKSSSRTLHSPLRTYYMVRNFLYLSRRYRRYFPAEVSFIQKGTLNRVKNNFLYGNNRWEVVRYVTKAVIDFRKGKMGKLKM